MNGIAHDASALTRPGRPSYSTAVSLGGVLLVALAVFGYFASVVGNFPGEVAISSWVQSWRSPWLDATMKAVSAPGFGALPVAIVASAGAALYATRRRKESVCLLGATVMASGLVSALKALVERPRPSGTVLETYADLGGSSFPSGHVVLYVVFLGTLVLLSTWDMRPSLTKKLIHAGLGVSLVAIGVSRVYLGAHWSADVVAGYAIGAVVVAATVGFWRLWRRQDSRRGTMLPNLLAASAEPS